jgi:primase-polymerase (primpol)-like protein
LTNFETAQQKAAAFGEPYGVGFVLTDQDPFWFLDIDNCLNSDSSWSPLATSLVSTFSGAAVEISSSQKGLHIIGTGAAPRHARINTVFDGNRNIGIEFYTEKRFIALTGINVTGDASFDATHLLPWLVENYFNPKKLIEDAQWTHGPCANWNGPNDDAELINRALRSHKSAQAVFGGGAAFADLWDANSIVLATAYPANEDSNKSSYNESKADAALAQHLAFWTGNDCERMLRLMKQSKLVREKWERHRYMELTILTACAFQNDRGEWLCDKPRKFWKRYPP